MIPERYAKLVFIANNLLNIHQYMHCPWRGFRLNLYSFDCCFIINIFYNLYNILNTFKFFGYFFIVINWIRGRIGIWRFISIYFALSGFILFVTQFKVGFSAYGPIQEFVGNTLPLSFKLLFIPLSLTRSASCTAKSSMSTSISFTTSASHTEGRSPTILMFSLTK